MATQVKVTSKTDSMLSELSKVRKESGELIRTKQDIVAELVLSLYKKELK